MAHPICPACGSVEHFRRASVVYRSERGHLQRGARVFTAETELAQRLAPPAPPGPPLHGYAGGCLLGLGALALLALGIGLTSAGLIALGAWLLLLGRDARTDHAAALEQHQQEVERWQRMWVCTRCGALAYPEE